MGLRNGSGQEIYTNFPIRQKKERLRGAEALFLTKRRMKDEY